MLGRARELGVDDLVAPTAGRARPVDAPQKICTSEKRAVEEGGLENVCRPALDCGERALLRRGERFVVPDARRQFFNGCPARD